MFFVVPFKTLLLTPLEPEFVKYSRHDVSLNFFWNIKAKCEKTENLSFLDPLN